MFSNPFRKRITHDELGQVFGDNFPPNVLKNYSDPELIGVVRESASMSQRDLLREWIAFNMFALYRGAAATFKAGYDVGAFFKSADRHCGRAFVAMGAFENLERYSDFLVSRLATYNTAMEDQRPPSPVYWIGKAYGEACRAEMKLSELYAWSNCFVMRSAFCKEVLGGLLRTSRLVK